ncbi:Fc.00g052780.m01.CDS01 [Cosmosporella sp. VM-42]
MGILPALESRPRLVLPDTPPELVSPGASSYSSSSSPSSGAPAWNSPAPASPSMSSYEKPTTADMSSAEQSTEVTQSRTEPSTQAAPRQQLPSLSSLFGPPTTVRPAHSPVLDGPGSYPATSPLDRPRVESSERSHPTSYFSQALSPPLSQPRSTYDSKFESERQPLHALARSYSGPGSPRYRDADHARPASRAEGQAGKWSMQQETSRHEYSLGSRDPPFRSPQSQFRLHFPGPKDPAAPSYPDQRPTHGGPNPPPTPTSTVNSEGIPSKDGLGPKIWTGTHFLPRFVRAAEVPGEGMCYFYDDGSHCKTVIDGEAVNAHWGVTKAGKPRKRLAIACVTCREKKIKCDPDFPRCVQCEKFGRVCKFKNAPRGGHNTSPSTPPAELDDLRRLGGPSRPGNMRASESEASSPVSPRTTLRQPSPDTASHKRLRVGYDSYVPVGEATPQMPRHMEPTRPQFAIPLRAAELPRIPDDVLNRAWRTDPYLSDPQSVRTVISHFFVHLDSTVILRFVPEETFKTWVASPSHRKSPEDLMLFYSILAVGVALSGGPKSIAYEYAQVAQYAQRMTGATCLQLAQSRILLALYHLSISRMGEANEMIAAAVATASCVQLNVELHASREAGLLVLPFGMTKACYGEMRRRTFWSLFMLERLNGLFPDRVAMINAEDIYIRLPADSDDFENRIEAPTPPFNPYGSHGVLAGSSGFGISTYLIEMVHIWSDDLARIYRISRHHGGLSEAESESTAQRVSRRLQDWQRSLPTRFAFTPLNLESAALKGNLGSFLTMHLLYCHAMIKLNRHTVTTGRSSPRSKSIHIQVSLEQASVILDIAKALVRLHRLGQTVISAPPPMMAIVVTEAVDVITASGRMSHLSDVIEGIRMAQGVVDAMGNVWEDSRHARESIDARLGMLLRIRDRGSQPTSPVEGYRIVLSAEAHEDEETLRWQIANPIEKLYPKDMDNIYSTLV